MSTDNWWRGPRSSGQLEARGETTWPGLSSSRRRPPRRKLRNEGDNVLEIRIREQARSVDRSTVLDNEGYPKLGQRLSKRKLQDHPGSSEEIIDLGNLKIEKSENNEEDRTSRKFSKKQKSLNVIRIDLEKVLERQRSLSESQTASSPKPRVKLNLNLSIRNQLDSARVIQCRKGIQREVPRTKRISKLKRVIFREREDKRQINIWKRELFEVEKIKAITRDVSEIDFNKLRISGEPKPEITFVRDMSSMTLFDNKHRKPPSDNIPDDHPETNNKNDVVKRLESLIIQKDYRDVSPEIDPRPKVCSQSDIEYMADSNIVTETLCLKICDETGETVEEFQESDVTPQTSVSPESEIVAGAPKHSRNFREYCTNDLTPGLNTAIENFLAETYRLQRRMYERDEVKGRYRRRFYAGFKEVLKHVESKKIRFVLIAPDLEGIQRNPGGLNELVSKLISACKVREVVFCFALNKRKLGYRTHKKGSVSCVGITNYAGLEENFKDVLTELMLARNSYERLISPGESGEILDPDNRDWNEMLLSTRINLLYKKLTLRCSS